MAKWNTIGRLSRWINARLSRYRPSEGTAILCMAVGVGVLAGVANIALRELLHFSHGMLFERGSRWLSVGDGGVMLLLLPLIPMVGGVLLVPLDALFPGEVRGYGLPRFLEKVNLRGGIFRARNIIAKICAASVTIGAGGSAGLEGPIAQIGGALGSVMGQVLVVGHERIRTLVACGVAAGISGSFNAPIAGVFFAHEIVLLRSFSAESFAPVVLSAGVGTLITHNIYGERPLFAVPRHVLGSPWEMGLYVGLGILLALLSVLFIRSFYKITDRFAAWRAPVWSKAVAGMGLTGVVGIFLPQVLGDGYHHIEAMLAGEVVGVSLLIVALAKILATGLTLGAGNAGGVFAPSLFIGAAAGAAYGTAAAAFFPDLNPGAFALVGMGGFLAAATHAPMTAIFLIFELTHDYAVIVPIMVTAVIGYAVSKKLHKDSIDTLALARRGVQLEEGREISVLESVRVEQVMMREVETVDEQMPLRQVLRVIPESRQITFPVVDPQGKLSGIISLQDFREVAYEEGLEDLVVAKELANPDVVVTFPDETIRDVLAKIGYRNIENIPVVSRADPGTLVGMVSRHDIVRAYNKALLGKIIDAERR